MKRIVSLLVVLAMLFCLCACGNGGDTTATTTGGETAPTTTAPIVADKTLNMFTGENDITGSNRPVAVMVTNEPSIRKLQYGLDKADFYVETEAEGSVPRIMAVFAGADRIPEKLGPIRSGRTPFIATANALGAVYVYSGATTYVTNILKGMKNFDRITNTDSTTLWRDQYLKNNAKESWNTLITGGKQIADKMAKSGMSNQALKKAPFTFGEKTGDITAATVQLKTTASTTVTFKYDAATGLYGKNLGKAASCNPHKSLEGNQIQVSNVLILQAEKYVEYKNTKYTWYNFREGEGKAYLVSNGKAREIKFHRTKDSLKFTELDGTSALFAKGKTYMCLTDKALADDLIFS